MLILTFIDDNDRNHEELITDDDMLREDIVVVTLEYRSGVLGFLSDGTKYMPGG